MTKDEEMALRELAAGRCTIQKVIDQLGPMSLWSKDGLERELAKARAEERKACLQDCADIQQSADNAIKRAGPSEYHEGRWRGAGQVDAAIKAREARGQQ